MEFPGGCSQMEFALASTPRGEAEQALGAVECEEHGEVREYPGSRN
jgi:hypothetical protein